MLLCKMNHVRDLQKNMGGESKETNSFNIIPVKIFSNLKGAITNYE